VIHLLATTSLRFRMTGTFDLKIALDRCWLFMTGCDLARQALAAASRGDYSRDGAAELAIPIGIKDNPG
jgi:hypothetical protein